MSDTPNEGPLDDIPWLPLDDDAEGGLPEPGSLGGFAYDGRAFTAQQFRDLILGTTTTHPYRFNATVPDYIVLHHTWRPTLQEWTANEARLSDEQIRVKRKKRLDWSLNDYAKKGWSSGPHLFIDDRYIWIFTPLNVFGTHAKWGNSHNVGGRPHYGIGIEVVGNYEQQVWSTPVAELVGQAVAALKERLGTFELRYMYPNGNPGRKQTGISPDGNPIYVCLHPERLSWGGISSHRDYNKPQCPGAAITEEYYIRVLQASWGALHASGPTTPVTLDSPVLGPASDAQARVTAFIQARLPRDSEYAHDVDTIMRYYWQYAPTVGIDPFVAAAQCVFETDGLKSHWAARPQRNPAGLGVHEEGGLSFATWEDGVQAHLGQLLALALRDDEASAAQRAMMQRNPRFATIPAAMRGTVKTIRDLSGRWSSSNSYADMFIARVAAIQKQ